MRVFGPVPSRRLGRSLGINNIPPKVCSYACVYCQLGRSLKLAVARQPFFEPNEIVRDVEVKLEQARKVGEGIDYLTFVPDGEPTLDINLGQTIEALRRFGIPIAVISNSSLIWDAQVRRELAGADWVSLKADTVREDLWHALDRPHAELRLQDILDGLREFARGFSGRLVTETMLVEGRNDEPDGLEDTARFVAQLDPAIAYLAIPTRPPAESWARAPSEQALTRAHQIFTTRLSHVELLTGYEGSAFAATGDAAEDLLSITAVHPMRHDAVAALLDRTGADWSVVESLIARRLLAETSYDGHRFYLRRLGVRHTAYPGSPGPAGVA